MASYTGNARPRWLLPLICLLAGLLIGWWIIGWWLWPVSYTNALPPDLRAAERDQYLIMVADSYGANGNQQLAKDRLAAWQPKQLADDLTRLQTRLTTENARLAGQVQQLAGIMGVAKTATPAPTRQPAQPTAPQAGSDLLALARQICVPVLYVALLLVGVLAVLWLYRRWKAAQATGAGPAIGPSAPFEPAERVARAASDIAEDAKSQWPRERAYEEPIRPPQQQTVSQPSAQIFDDAELVEDEEWEEVTPQPAAQVQAPPRATAPATPAADRAILTPLGEFPARFQMGEADYDEAFDISGKDGAFVGQCGLELTDPIGRSHDQAGALQVWLWDHNDPDTKIEVLMSDGAYRDTGLRDQLAAGHPVIPVQEGTPFELETYKLLLRGVVEKVAYAQYDPPRRSSRSWRCG